VAQEQIHGEEIKKQVKGKDNECREIHKYMQSALNERVDTANKFIESIHEDYNETPRTPVKSKKKTKGKREKKKTKGKPKQEKKKTKGKPKQEKKKTKGKPRQEKKKTKGIIRRVHKRESIGKPDRVKKQRTKKKRKKNENDA
jgi:hypothetical protein